MGGAVVWVALFLVLIGVRPALADARQGDDMERRTQACVACHGEAGRASREGYFPRIAGKPAGYLYQQLLHFRDGLRRHDGMRYLLERQSDAYLREMAAYFAALDLPYPPPQTVVAAPEVLARGAALVESGDAALDVPACQACHGARLTGVEPSVPGLLGLPQDYLAAQFGAWREGTRQSSAPDCMQRIAQRLSLADISAVSAWLAAQPVPDDSRADALPPESWPMPCGGVDDGGLS